MIVEKLAALGAREKIWLAVAGVGLFAALVDRTAVEYTARQFRSLNTAVQKESERLAENQRVVRDGRLALDEYLGIRKFLAEMPAGADVVGRLKADIDELAGEAGLSILSIKHRETRASFGGYYKECFVEIEKFEAGMKELLTFLHCVSSSPKMLRVERLTLAPQSDGSRVSGAMTIGKIVVVGEVAGEPVDAATR
ncbi:MAG: hypothetical protein QME60_03820 [Verrucomicrobiota bacterium]|nr:hypothetical protein [Verrucomicrobiota bacterium]